MTGPVEQTGLRVGESLKVEKTGFVLLLLFPVGNFYLLRLCIMKLVVP